jgi:uncharacterized protein involved in exopolysaccharide biosynthesis
MESNETLLDVRDLFWKAKQYRFHLLFPVLLVLCGAFIYYKISVPIYESYVILGVGERGSLSPTIDALARPDRESSAPRERVALLSNRIHSREFLSQLIDRSGMRASIQAAAKAAGPDEVAHPGVTTEEYMLRIAMTNIGRRLYLAPLQGNLVRMTVQASNPVQARDLVSAGTDLLLQQSLQSTLERVEARSVFSGDQISVWQDRLRRSEEELRDYKESILGRGLQTSLINESNLDVARNLVRINEEEIQQISSRISSERGVFLSETQRTLSLPNLETSATVSMGRRLEGLEVSLANASLGGERGLSEASSLRGQIAELRQALLSEFENAAAAAIPDASYAARAAAAGVSLDRTLLRSLRAKDARFTSQIAAFTQRVRSSPRDQMELERLEGAVAGNRQMLSTLQKEIASSQMSQALATSELGVKLEVIESAQVPLHPIFPSRTKIFGGALLLGPLLSLGLVFALEKLGAVIQSVEQAEQELGAKVIGTVPRVEGWGQPGSFLQNHWPALSIVVVLLITGIFYTVNNVLRPAPSYSRPATTDRP